MKTMHMADPVLTEADYEDFVAERFTAARSGEPIVFTNRGNTHARAVLGHLISNAKECLDIYTGSLSGDVYRADELRLKCRALGIGKTRMVIGDPPKFLEFSALKLLQSEIEEGFIVPRYANLAVARINELNHFAIADKTNLRVEQSHIEKTAVVVLNADQVRLPTDPTKTLAENYCELFESIFTAATEYKALVSA